jgi:hypothetical protein
MKIFDVNLRHSDINENRAQISSFWIYRNTLDISILFYLINIIVIALPFKAQYTIQVI